MDLVRCHMEYESAIYVALTKYLSVSYEQLANRPFLHDVLGVLWPATRELRITAGNCLSFVLRNHYNYLETTQRSCKDRLYRCLILRRQPDEYPKPLLKVHCCLVDVGAQYHSLLLRHWYVSLPLSHFSTQPYLKYSDALRISLDKYHGSRRADTGLVPQSTTDDAKVPCDCRLLVNVGATDNIHVAFSPVCNHLHFYIKNLVVQAVLGQSQVDMQPEGCTGELTSKRMKLTLPAPVRYLPHTNFFSTYCIEL